MACLDVAREIDGVNYKIVQFPARQGLGIKARLVKFIGPLFDSIYNSGTLNEGLMLSKFTEKLGEELFVNLVIELLSYTYREGKKITIDTFDVEFAGEYLHLYKVAIAVIEVNGFFGKGNIMEALNSLIGTMSQILPTE